MSEQPKVVELKLSNPQLVPQNQPEHPITAELRSLGLEELAVDWQCAYNFRFYLLGTKNDE